MVITKRGGSVITQATGVDPMVPDMDKRVTMNVLLLGAVGLSIGAIGVPFATFFVPPSSGGGSGG